MDYIDENRERKCQTTLPLDNFYEIMKTRNAVKTLNGDGHIMASISTKKIDSGNCKSVIGKQFLLCLSTTHKESRLLFSFRKEANKEDIV